MAEGGRCGVKDVGGSIYILVGDNLSAQRP